MRCGIRSVICVSCLNIPVSWGDVSMVLTGVLQRHPFTSCLPLRFGSAFAPYNLQWLPGKRREANSLHDVFVVAGRFHHFHPPGRSAVGRASFRWRPCDHRHRATGTAPFLLELLVLCPTARWRADGKAENLQKMVGCQWFSGELRASYCNTYESWLKTSLSWLFLHLSGDGTVVCWGDPSAVDTRAVSWLPKVICSVTVDTAFDLGDFLKLSNGKQVWKWFGKSFKFLSSLGFAGWWNGVVLIRLP